jgi:hypothetical protein
MVEERRDGEGFGKGRKVAQSFAQVVAQVRQGDDTHYLTTQEVISPCWAERRSAQVARCPKVDRTTCRRSPR